MPKKPKFFCEYCGAEVRRNDRVCPKCGKFFASVRCPACGFTGDTAAFRDGCPACGYAVFSGSPRARPERARREREGADPLPWWIYLLCVLTLGLVAAIILSLR